MLLQIFNKLWLYSVLTLISACAFAAEERDSNTVYYTELTCNPKKDLFEMYPKSITKAELAKKTDDTSTALKNRQYGVFLNGKLVGGKVFKDTCELQNEMSIEVDVDYGRPSLTQFCGNNIPQEYRVFFNHIVPDCLGFSKGEVVIRKNDTAIAAASNSLTYTLNEIRNKDNKNYNISYKKGTLSIVTIPSAIKKLYSLEEMQEKPLLIKSMFLDM